MGDGAVHEGDRYSLKKTRFMVSKVMGRGADCMSIVQFLDLFFVVSK